MHVPTAIQATVTTDLGTRHILVRRAADACRGWCGQPAKGFGTAVRLAALRRAREAEPPRVGEADVLVRSSYGSTFGVLRRNGRFLYISDLLNFRGYPTACSRSPMVAAAPIDGTMRAVHQRIIRRQLDELDDVVPGGAGRAQPARSDPTRDAAESPAARAGHWL